WLSAAQAPSESPVDLVRATVKNELQASDDAKFMFKDYKESATGTQTKLLVETKDGMAGIVIAENGHPLNEQQRQAEIARVGRFLNNPEELRKKQKREKEDTERVNRIMRALPDAFIYEYNGTETGKEGL